MGKPFPAAPTEEVASPYSSGFVAPSPLGVPVEGRLDAELSSGPIEVKWAPLGTQPALMRPRAGQQPGQEGPLAHRVAGLRPCQT